MRKFTWSLIGIFLLINHLPAQIKRPMTMVDLINVPSLRDPQLSPDGKQLLYVLGASDWDENKMINHIWRIGTNGKNAVQMTNGIKSESSPRWSPDGKQIAFTATRGDAKETQIFLIANNGGEAIQFTGHETSVSSITWAPDGKSIYFMASNPKSADEKKRDKAKDDVYAYEENFQQRHLWNIDIGDKTETRITDGDYSLRGYNLSRDGKLIAHSRAPSPVLEVIGQSEIWIMDSDGGNAKQITHNNFFEGGAKLSPNNKTIVYTSWVNAEGVPYHNDNIFLIPASGGATKMILKDMPYDVYGPEWSADGKSLYFPANTGVRIELFQVIVASEKLTQLTKGDHALSSWNYYPDRRQHIFGLNTQTNAGDFFIMAARRNAKPKQITHVYDYLAKDYLLPRQETITWKGEDGAVVEGLIYYPLDYKKGTAYPLVVQTHGGPAASDKFGFGASSRYVQVLAAKGYVVLKPNYRGSTGYGDAFMRDMVGSYYNQSHLDVMTGVDHLISIGIADGDRMVKMGWSAGGHMTNKIITFTDRFKAASSGAGAVNWISMYGQSDTRMYRTPWFGGTPWQKDAPIDVYWDNSPLKDIWKVKTPTIILVGQNDYRVPLPQSQELYRALMSNGVATHLYIAPREPHGWRELRHRLFKMNVELDWFEKYAMDREYEWETAPEKEDKEAENGK